MRVFSHNQRNMFFLSPYTSVNVRPDGLAIHQTVFGSAIKVDCKSGYADELIKALSVGIEEQDLLSLFEGVSNGCSKEMLNLWIKTGVIE